MSSEIKDKQTRLDKTDANRKYRFERKVPMQIAHYSEFWHYLYQLGLFPRKSFPKREIHSVYLDKHTFEFYLDNVAGISQRSKTRLRWYNDTIEKLTLEEKIKHNKVSTKPTLALVNESRQLPTSRTMISKLFNSNAVPADYTMLKSLYPILQVSYVRDYYLLDKDIRMTVDRQIKYKKLYPVANSNFEDSVVDVVVEFKYPKEKQTIVNQLLVGLPFRLFRHSKYAIGIEMVYT